MTVPSEPSSESIAITLSGGGSRAALFSLGALWCVVDLHLNEDVDAILSVSGSSITNAAVGRQRNFGEISSDEYASLAGSLGYRLANKGAQFDENETLRVYLVHAAVVAGLIAAVLTVRNIDSVLLGDERFWPRTLGMIAVLIVVSGVVAIVTTMLDRRRIQRATLAKILGDHRGNMPNDLQPGRTAHIIVATDLVSGKQVYFAREFIFSPAYGWANPEDIGLADAVYASSAFPVAFPAIAMNSDRLKFSNGRLAAPGWVHLVDGGIANNLGTDWFESIRSEGKRLWRYGSSGSAESQYSTALVINASRNPSATPRGRGIFRIAKILYENTILPRVSSIRSGMSLLAGRTIIVDISESPLELAGRMASIHGERGRRAHQVEETLMREGREYWMKLVSEVSTISTSFKPVGTATAAQLAHLGYVSMFVALHVETGRGDSNNLPPVGFFERTMEQPPKP